MHKIRNNNSEQCEIIRFSSNYVNELYSHHFTGHIPTVPHATKDNLNDQLIIGIETRFLDFLLVSDRLLLTDQPQIALQATLLALLSR